MTIAFNPNIIGVAVLIVHWFTDCWIAAGKPLADWLIRLGRFLYYKCALCLWTLILVSKDFCIVLMGPKLLHNVHKYSLLLNWLAFLHEDVAKASLHCLLEMWVERMDRSKKRTATSNIVPNFVSNLSMVFNPWQKALIFSQVCNKVDNSFHGQQIAI